MRHRLRHAHGGWFAALLFALLARSYGQQASHWREFEASDNNPTTLFHSVTISESGSVLAADPLSSRFCIFDGYETKSFAMPEGAARVCQSPAGQLWSVSAQGLWIMQGEQWKLHVQTDPQAASWSSQIPLYPVRQNVVLCLLPDRLVECGAEDPSQLRMQTLRSATNGGIGMFTAMAVGIEDELWIVSERGLIRIAGPVRSLTPASPWRAFLPPDSLHLQRLRHPQPDQNGLMLAADSSEDGQSRLVHFDGDQWQTLDFNKPRTNPKLFSAWHGPDNSLWAASMKDLWRGSAKELKTDASLSPRQYYDASADWRGTFWLATSSGLVRYTPNLWQTGQTNDGVGATLVSMARTGRWPQSPGEITSFDMDPPRALPTESASGVVFKPIGLLRDGRACYASAPTRDSDHRNRIAVFDGTNFQSLPIFVPEEVASSNISCALATEAGDFWIGGDFGVAWLHRRWTIFPVSENSASEKINHLAELPGGQIWSAARDKIWSFNGKDWSLVRAGFNHINAMICARDGSVWVADDAGVTRFFKGNWIANGPPEGLARGAVPALCEDQRGGLWAATGEKVEFFHPEAESDPPRTFIVPMGKKESNIPEEGMIIVRFRGQAKWNVTPPGRLLYSYRLDTGEWSPFDATDNASFSDLPPGRHYFQVRSMDRAGNIDPNPPQLDFAVMLPWYKEGRLVLIASAGAITAGFFAVLAWRRHSALVLSYAQVEKQVAQRTKELELANLELLQSQKMRALGTLAAGIAHDFNNILSIVKGSTQIIEDNIDNPEKIRTRANRIKTVVDQGSSVVQALLGFSRGSDDMLEACEINPVVDNTLKLLGDRFLREVELQFERSPALPRVRASQSLVQQILLNFIFNAAESMNGQKRVIITTVETVLPAHMALPPAAANGYVAVAVRDFGCGIPAENMARVFEPFFTTKALSTRRGTGLGLSIVYELAKKMEAGLALESTVGQGSVFSLLLPAEVPSAPATSTAT